MTLTDREYQHMRDVGIAIIRAVGVDTGGCNIQFAVDPQDGRLVVIEMNPRVSRSSALASKATGLPYRQDRRPARDRVHPRRGPQRHHCRDAGVLRAGARLRRRQGPAVRLREVPCGRPHLTTHMKSVGEAMAIGRNIPEALQKALRSIEKCDASVLVDRHHRGRRDPGRAEPAAARRADQEGAAGDVARGDVETLHEATGIDPWFLDQIAVINEVAAQVQDAAELDALPHPPGQAVRILRPTARRAARCLRGGRTSPAAGARNPPGLQDGRHVRR